MAGEWRRRVDTGSPRDDLEIRNEALSCRWHRLAVSVEGDVVTLVTDCEPQPPVSSQGPRSISTAGLTVLGTQDVGEEAFEVGVMEDTEAEVGRFIHSLNQGAQWLCARLQCLTLRDCEAPELQ